MNGDTPLHWACYKGRTNSVNYLINAGANTDTQNTSGFKPLDCAIENGHKDIVMLFIELEKQKVIKSLKP